MFFCYAGLLGVLLHNIIRFVYMQRRYRFFHIAYFYMLVTLIVLMRVIWFAFILIITTKDQLGELSIEQQQAIFLADVMATYLELLLGIQQACSMFELFLMIRKSVLSIEPSGGVSDKSSFLTMTSGVPQQTAPGPIILQSSGKLEKLNKVARILLFFVSSAVVITMTVIMFSRDSSSSNAVYSYTTMTFFLGAGVACLVMLSLLIHIIQKSFTDELNKETRQLLLSQSIFVLTFLLRCCLIVLVIENLWIDFSRDYPDGMTKKGSTAMFPLQFFIYNIVPYNTLAFMHYQNYRPDPRLHRETFPTHDPLPHSLTHSEVGKSEENSRSVVNLSNETVSNRSDYRYQSQVLPPTHSDTNRKSDFNRRSAGAKTADDDRTNFNENVLSLLRPESSPSSASANAEALHGGSPYVISTTKSQSNSGF